MVIVHLQWLSGSLTQPHVNLMVESAINDTRILGDTSAELGKQGPCDMRPRTSFAHLRDDLQPSSPKGALEIAKKVGVSLIVNVLASSYPNFVLDEISLLTDGRLTKAICMLCKVTLSARSTAGTTHLLCHVRLKVSHARPSLHFDQNVPEEILAKMVIMHGYPFGMMDHSLFQEFVASIQPQFKIGDQKALHNNCIFLYMRTRKSIMNEISSISQVALSTDIWELNDMKNYVVMTATSQI
ncbi:hypothetical protein MJO28_005940 [Puccinia striiformis f. sp. tritici]|uniref:Uncharacterized protein n=1 Tax=Puccinia striiformis f. sp. tritici TaxID=168172 RepID=A0ACC0EFZ8_9BASI|nr:hypothetical protein MJO28_005940 [Puccinia striiformis f. sp. tritici]